MAEKKIRKYRKIYRRKSPLRDNHQEYFHIYFPCFSVYVLYQKDPTHVYSQFTEIIERWNVQAPW